MRTGASTRQVRSCLRLLHALAWLVLTPALAFAQSQITGTVKDVSGAVLPGVTVEASSPALIEQLRTAVTDASGQYRLVDLRPGVYAVTFKLPGFNTFKREAIELPDAFIATINADLAIGSLEETVTVTGASPIVDVRSVRRQNVASAATRSGNCRSRALMARCSSSTPRSRPPGTRTCR